MLIACVMASLVVSLWVMVCAVASLTGVQAWWVMVCIGFVVLVAYGGFDVGHVWARYDTINAMCIGA